MRCTSCKDCFNNCDKTMSDKCVKYTGPAIEWLGICTGDPLSELEEVLIEKLQEVTTGIGIEFEDIELCDAIEDELDGEDPTLENLLTAVIAVLCSVKEDVDTIQNTVDPPSSFETSCLDVPDNPTKDEILQALATKVCGMSTIIDTVSEDYVKSSELCSLVQECIDGSTPVATQEYSKMPKYVALPYHGSLSVFDANGAGLSASGYDKVYICLGQTVNGFALPDYRGRTPVGANNGLPGGAMDAEVDPAVLANAGYNISKNTKKGAYTHTLTEAQLASHSHSVTDPGHTHTVPYKHGEADQNESGTYGDLMDNTSLQNQFNETTLRVTGVTIGSAGASQPHNNTQPSMGAVFIMYVPS